MRISLRRMSLTIIWSHLRGLHRVTAYRVRGAHAARNGYSAFLLKDSISAANRGYRSLRVSRDEFKSFTRGISTKSPISTFEEAQSIQNIFSVSEEKLSELRKNVGTPEAVDVLQDIIKNECSGIVLPAIFEQLFPFKLDEFQMKALTALNGSRNVVLGSPTGSGKTVAGELAIYYALALGLRVFYTTPLKALSNQKFNDFRQRFGSERVGLMTGDASYNRGAQVTVMTTEVFRNMLYKAQVPAGERYAGDYASELENVYSVILDEFHYLNDQSRGTVWEESVICCPPNILIVALSATMSNVVDLADWIRSTHGPTELVTSSFRPVPLRRGIYHLFRDIDAGPGSKNGVEFSNRESKSGKKSKGVDQLKVNVELERIDQEQRSALISFENKRHGHFNKLRLKSRDGKTKVSGGRNGREGSSKTKYALKEETPSYGFLVRKLHQRDMLPAIIFVFSRDRCERAAKEVFDDLRQSLLDDSEREIVLRKLEAYDVANPQVPLDVERCEMLLSGVSSHHAGLLPAYKLLVEELFARNACKVVFATETLAAGINMPAKSTVISSLKKWSDTGLTTLLPSQLLQMAGRAGRRGMDKLGNVVFMQNVDSSVRDAHRLLLSPLDAIESRFKSSYSMAINILRTRNVASAKKLVEKSFGSFLKSKTLVPSQQKTSEAETQLRSIVNSYPTLDFVEAAAYKKLWDALKKEERTLEYLKGRDFEDNLEVIETVLPLVRIGATLLLTDQSTVALVGEHPGPQSDNSWCTVLRMNGTLAAIGPQHISYVEIDETKGLDVKSAAKVQSMIRSTSNMKWLPETLDELNSLDWSERRNFGSLSDILLPSSEAAELLDKEFLKESGQQIPPLGVIPIPGHILRQQAAVSRAAELLEAHPIHRMDESIRNVLLHDLKDIATLQKKIRRGWNSEMDHKQPAWGNFVAITEILLKYGALLPEDSTQLYADIESNTEIKLRSTAFGDLIGGINADNELWLSLVLTHPAVKRLTYIQLATLIPVVTSDFSRPDTINLCVESPEVKSCIDQLSPLGQELDQLQLDADVQLPVYLNINIGGIVERWASGCEWTDLCRGTSMDDGDLCRVLRRTVDILKQIALLKGADPLIRDNARRALHAMDRFPVSDDLMVDEFSEESDDETDTLSMDASDETENDTVEPSDDEIE